MKYIHKKIISFKENFNKIININNKQMILIVYLNHVFYVKNGISSEILLQKMVL